MPIELFRQNVLFLAQQARALGLTKLDCYATSLDFFQNPMVIAEHLAVLADVQQQTDVRIGVRCLSCLDSFLRASREIPNFADVVRRSGLWCVGFGVDGTNEETWRAQRKVQNHLNDVAECLDICQAIGVRPEILMVLGFPEDDWRRCWSNFKNSIRYAWRWRTSVSRPYLAKPFIPGNEGWVKQPDRAQQLIDDPQRFFNLDFCALGSQLTHPDWRHRWMCNLTYLAIIIVLTPLGRCVTSPLLPQGSGGLGGRLGKVINRWIPFDH